MQNILYVLMQNILSSRHAESSGKRQSVRVGCVRDLWAVAYTGKLGTGTYFPNKLTIAGMASK